MGLEYRDLKILANFQVNIKQKRFSKICPFQQLCKTTLATRIVAKIVKFHNFAKFFHYLFDEGH